MFLPKTRPVMASPEQNTTLSFTERANILKKLKRELVRQRTFKNWPVRTQKPQTLAKAGFFYFNDGDKVQCAFCLGIIGEWEENDDPFREHKTHFPRCPFALGLPVGNVAIGLNGREEKPRIRDEGIEIESDLNFPQPLRDQRENSEPEKGWRIPKHPAFSETETRLKTFQTWPRGIAQKPENLAEAGLYYTGIGDLTVCFFCGGEIQFWEENDTPWDEHAARFPHCKYLVAKKGRDFIRKNDVDLFQIDAKKFMYAEPAITFLNSGYSYQQIKEVIGNILRKKIVPSFSNIESELLKVAKPIEEKKDFLCDPLCKICRLNKISFVLLPCSHLCACRECVKCLNACPLCNTDVKGYIRVFY